MIASGRMFALLLSEGEEMVPLLNKAVDCIGALALAIMFSKIDEDLARKADVAVKTDGSLRTRGGVALQYLRQSPFAGYIFARGSDSRRTEWEAMLKRQDAVRSRAEFQAMTNGVEKKKKMPLPTLPDSSDDGSDDLAPCPSPVSTTLSSSFQNCSLTSSVMTPCDSP